MRKQLTAVVAFGCLFAAATALADGLPSRVRYAEPSYQPLQPPIFSGFYVGAHVGYAVGDTSATTFATAPVLTAHDVRGGLGGLQIGYNARIGYTLIGIEGDYSWLDADSSSVNGADAVSARLKYLASIRGRAGIVADSLLLYLTAGIGWGGTDFRLTDGVIGTEAFRLDETGIVFGAGAELALTRNWSVRAEFLRYDFGGDRRALLVDGDARFDSVDVVRIGVNYIFGPRMEPGPWPLK